MLKDNFKRLLCSITQERDFYAQGQLQETSFAQSHKKETSMLKDNSKRLPFLNHNWKRLLLTIINNWIRFWILDIQSEVFTKQYKQNRLCWCVCDVLHREYWPFLLCCLVVLFVLQVFIPIYRGFERRWELAVTSTCLAWSFDSSPLILCLIW